MKNQLFGLLLVGLLWLPVVAQKAEKPKLAAAEPTAAQKTLIQEGIALHDSRKYDQAIEKYQTVLDENPDCTRAMYEMALSYHSKGDLEKSIEIASKGIKYTGPELPMFYILIGNTWDEQGNPQKSLEIYQDAIKVLKDDKENTRALGSVYYNMGVTYVGLKQYKEAREAMKKAVESNFGYGSPNFVLGVLFEGGEYKVPAMLAAARLISLELNTARTKRSVGIFLKPLQSAKKDEKTNSINIYINMNAPKDEGDYSVYELLLGTLMTVKADQDDKKTEEEIFASAVETLIGILADDKKLKSTFVGRNYVPFMTEMKRLGYAKIFAYLVLQQNGNETAEKWLTDNAKKTLEFLEWAKTYSPPK
ncbi:MAG: tetratricopeptide repeat protein [Acidobacteria bacterium]|nr:tetratricopeptide repeat protein [Acidobacteriota bacterium]